MCTKRVHWNNYCKEFSYKKCIHEKKNNVKEFDEFIQLKGGVKILAILVLCVVVVERAGNYTMHTQLNRDLYAVLNFFPGYYTKRVYSDNS